MRWMVGALLSAFAALVVGRVVGTAVVDTLEEIDRAIEEAWSND